MDTQEIQTIIDQAKSQAAYIKANSEGWKEDEARLQSEYELEFYNTRVDKYLQEHLGSIVQKAVLNDNLNPVLCVDKDLKFIRRMYERLQESGQKVRIENSDTGHRIYLDLTPDAGVAQ